MASSSMVLLGRKPLDARALLASASVEVSSRGHSLEQLRDGFAPGLEVTITFLPGDDCRHTIATATRLRRLGYHPVPHIAARGLASKDAFDEFLARICGEADVRHILLIAGDMALPRGPFASSLGLCRSGVVERHGIDRVTIAGHPEGHPNVDMSETFASIAARRDWAQNAGIKLGILTQFCFEAGPILDLFRALATRGLRLPVRVGLAGPATPATLMTYALRCGIGKSMNAVRDRIGPFGRLLVDAGPDQVILDIAKSQEDATVLLEGFHVYPLGGLRKTNEWIQAAVNGDTTAH